MAEAEGVKVQGSKMQAGEKANDCDDSNAIVEKGGNC